MILQHCVTWLSNLDKSEDYKIPGYQLPIHTDRALGRVSYGWVMVWISNSIGCKMHNDLETDVEIMWLEVRTSNKKLFLFIACRSKANTDLTYCNKFQENTDSIRV